MNSFPDLNVFLSVKTPQKWLEAAAQNPDILLIDHAKSDLITTPDELFRFYSSVPV